MANDDYSSSSSSSLTTTKHNYRRQSGRTYLGAMLERLGQESVTREDSNVLPVLDMARRHPPVIYTCDTYAFVGRQAPVIRSDAEPAHSTPHPSPAAAITTTNKLYRVCMSRSIAWPGGGGFGYIPHERKMRFVYSCCKIHAASRRSRLHNSAHESSLPRCSRHLAPRCFPATPEARACLQRAQDLSTSAILS